jgi:hypothetical protein
VSRTRLHTPCGERNSKIQQLPNLFHFEFAAEKTFSIAAPSLLESAS